MSNGTGLEPAPRTVRGTLDTRREWVVYGDDPVQNLLSEAAVGIIRQLRHEGAMSAAHDSRRRALP